MTSCRLYALSIALIVSAASHAAGLALSVDGKEVPVCEFTREYDYATFVYDGATTELEVRAPDAIGEASVSPLVYPAGERVSSDRLAFTAEGAVRRLVEIDGRRLVLGGHRRGTYVPRNIGVGLKDIVSFGADPTGRVSSSPAIAKAIAAVKEHGGGTVFVPSGTFLFTEPIVIGSGMELFLDAGAVLKADAASKGFGRRGYKSSLKLDFTWLIYTEENTRGASIRGYGVIDGSGTDMRLKHKLLATVVAPIGADGFTMEGVTVVDGAFWTVVPARCSRLVVSDVRIYNDVQQLYENDAIDICDCQDVLVKDVFAVSEDDTFSTKTWQQSANGIAGEWYGEPRENRDVVFDNCFGWTHCGAFKVGDGNFQAHRRITFRNCQSYRSMSALKVTHGYGTEPAEDIVFENIDIEGFGGRDRTAKWMDFYLLSDGPVNNVTVRNVNIRPGRGFDATLKGKNDRFFYDDVTIEGIVIAGQPVHSLEDMRITNRNAYVRNLIVR